MVKYLLLLNFLIACAPESIDMMKANKNFNASISNPQELELNICVASKDASIIKKDISKLKDPKKLGHALIDLIEQSEYQEDTVSIENFINSISPEILGEAINHRNEKGLTPLSAAAMSGKNKIIKLLLGKGADPMLPRVYGERTEDPLQIVCVQGNDEALSYFDLTKIPQEHRQRIASKIEIHHPKIALKLRKID